MFSEVLALFSFILPMYSASNLSYTCLCILQALQITLYLVPFLLNTT